MQGWWTKEKKLEAISGIKATVRTTGLTIRQGLSYFMLCVERPPLTKQYTKKTAPIGGYVEFAKQINHSTDYALYAEPNHRWHFIEYHALRCLLQGSAGSTPITLESPLENLLHIHNRGLTLWLIESVFGQENEAIAGKVPENVTQSAIRLMSKSTVKRQPLFSATVTDTDKTSVYGFSYATFCERIIENIELLIEAGDERIDDAFMNAITYASSAGDAPTFC